MVMPPDPVADLVVAEARLARAALEAFFDAVFRLGRTSELDGGRGAAAFERSSSWLSVPSDGRSRVMNSISTGPVPPVGVRAGTRRMVMSNSSGPGSPSRTSSVVHAVSGSDRHHRSTRCRGVFGGRPCPESSGGGTSASRNSVFDGIASRSRSSRVRNAARNGPQRPISSSPVTPPCGSNAPLSSSISRACSCRVWNFTSSGTPATRHRARSFVHSLGRSRRRLTRARS